MSLETFFFFSVKWLQQFVKSLKVATFKALLTTRKEVKYSVKKKKKRRELQLLNNYNKYEIENIKEKIKPQKYRRKSSSPTHNYNSYLYYSRSSTSFYESDKCSR